MFTFYFHPAIYSPIYPSDFTLLLPRLLTCICFSIPTPSHTPSVLSREHIDNFVVNLELGQKNHMVSVLLIIFFLAVSFSISFSFIFPFFSIFFNLGYLHFGRNIILSGSLFKRQIKRFFLRQVR